MNNNDDNTNKDAMKQKRSSSSSMDGLARHSNNSSKYLKYIFVCSILIE